MRILSVATMPVGFGPEHWGLIWIEKDGDTRPHLACKDPAREACEKGDTAAADPAEALRWANARADWLRASCARSRQPQPLPSEPTPSGLQYIVPGCEKVHSSRAATSSRTKATDQLDLF